MNIEEFALKKPFLYHLTDRENLKLIKSDWYLMSTKKIALASFSNRKMAMNFLMNKRNSHEQLVVNDRQYKIRDQKPISIKVLGRSLSDGLSTGDFIELLNSRVFWWPTINRLERHFGRYEEENPIILRVKTADLLALNEHVEFCRLNSGATRCNHTYNGNAPTRGKDTFQPPNLYLNKIASVAEVTFPNECFLPEDVWIGSNPNGPWKKI